MANVTITINESDSYGDGGQGQGVRIFDSNGVEVAAHTLESGSSGSDTFTLSDVADYTWTFGECTYINEATRKYNYVFCAPLYLDGNYG